MISEFFYITKTAKAGHFFLSNAKNAHALLNPCGFMWGSVKILTLQQSAYNFLITLQFGPKKKIQFRKKFSISCLMVDVGGIL